MAQFSPRDLIGYFTKNLKATDPEPLGKFGLLFFSPWDLKRATRELEGAPLESWSWKAHGVYRSEIFKELFLLSTLIGAPNLAMSMEEYAAFGVEKIIIVGYAGGLGLEVGSIAVPEWAMVAEGASLHYGKKWEEKSYPSENLKEAILEFFRKKGIDAFKGGVVSTSSPYRETGEFLDKCYKMGCIAVDMEISTAFTLGEVLRMDVAAVLVVTDKVYPGKWEPGFFSDTFKTARRRVFSLLKDLSREVFFGGEST